MAKPLSKFALFLWIVAGLVILSQIIVEPIIHRMTLRAAPEFMRPDAQLGIVLWYFNTIRSGLVTTTFLVAMGCHSRIARPDQMECVTSRSAHRIDTFKL